MKLKEILKKFNSRYIKNEKSRRKKKMKRIYYTVFDTKIENIKKYIEDNDYEKALDKLNATKKYLQTVKFCNGEE